TVDPTQGPLQPAETQSAEPEQNPEQQPAANQSAQPAAAQQQPPEPPQPQKPAEPTGTAAAQKGRTAGGAASQPAGTAIAPAKQRQVRSLLIKLGLIAGAGIAFGTVYALSHQTPSVPPGARTTAVTTAVH
ncbi:MAG: hypothetical protein DMG66_07040, partial [Acidobacteria bacterium]